MKALIVAAALAAGCSITDAQTYSQGALADQSMGAYRAQLEAQKQQIE
jgi:hypothetical protein